MWLVPRGVFQHRQQFRQARQWPLEVPEAVWLVSEAGLRHQSQVLHKVQRSPGTPGCAHGG